MRSEASCFHQECLNQEFQCDVRQAVRNCSEQKFLCKKVLHMGTLTLASHCHTDTFFAAELAPLHFCHEGRQKLHTADIIMKEWRPEL